MNSKYLDRIKKIVADYVYEMMDEAAWSGHEYAAKYLSELRHRILELCKSMEEKNKEASLDLRLKQVVFYLKDDYKALIDKIYALEVIGKNETDVIASALDEAFKNELHKAIRELADIYSLISGEKLVVFEE